MDPVVAVSAASDVLARWDEPARSLTADERARAAQLRRAPDVDDFVAAHLLVRECVGRLIGVHPDSVRIEQRCGTCGGSHGAPSVADRPEVFLSWAHSAGWVAAVAADRVVGIDLEARAAAPNPTPQLLRRVGTPAEVAAIIAADEPGGAFLALWVRKEALVKAGALTLDDFGSIALADVAGYELRAYDDDAVIAQVALAHPT